MLGLIAVRSLLTLATACGFALGQVYFRDFDFDKSTYLPSLVDGSVEMCSGWNTGFIWRGGDIQDSLNYCKGMKPVSCGSGDPYALPQIPPGDVPTDEVCDTWGDILGNTHVAYWTHYRFNVTCNYCPEGMILALSKCADLDNIPPNWNACAGCLDSSKTPMKDDNGDIQCVAKCGGGPSALMERTGSANNVLAVEREAVASTKSAQTTTKPRKKPTKTKKPHKSTPPPCKPTSSTTTTSTPTATPSSCTFPPPPPPKDAGCKMNDAGMDLLKSGEKCASDFYKIGGDTTIGWGHDCTQKKDCTGPKFKVPMSLETADAILEGDVSVATQHTKALPNAKYLNANQFSALIDFAFNGGRLSKFVDDMNAKNFTAICDKLPSTTATVHGKPNKGVRNRRIAENKLCKTPTDQASGCP